MTVDFSAITDLVNATLDILGAFVDNQTVLVNFAVLLIILSVVAYIGIWVKGFLGKMINKTGSGGK